MDSQESSFKGLKLPRTKSNQNLKSSTDCFFGKGTKQFLSANSPSKSLKLDTILHTLKAFKNTLSTTDLHSTVRSSQNCSKISNNLASKNDESFTFDKKRSFCLVEGKEKSIKKQLLNSPSNKYLQVPKKEENSCSKELKHLLSLESLREVKKREIIMRKNDIFGNSASSTNLYGQNSIKQVFSLEFQKNSLEAIKEKLQKYGINTSKNINQSRVNLIKSEKYPQRQKLQRQIQNLQLVSSRELSPTLIKEIKDQLKKELRQEEDLISRPLLTSLKQKKISFRSPVLITSKSRQKNNSISARNSIHSDERMLSTLESIASNNLAKINLQKENFQELDLKGNTLKQKPGSYGNKNSIKSIFQPSRSFSIHSQAPSLNLKQTLETNCTVDRLQKKLTIKDFIIGRQIGKGKFGRVYICTHRQTGFLCAMKIIKKDLIKKERSIEQLIREIKIQSYLNHTNSVKMYAFFHDCQNIYLLIEYCIEGQLYSLLRMKKKFSEDETIAVIRDICEALKHLHENGIIHRDIKPENIVISFQVSKLCDFGWSVNSQNLQRETFCGTPLYVSPELLLGKTYDCKVDIWALGIMVYELLTGKLPFQITSQKELRKIVTNQVHYPENLSENAKNFIQHLLQKNPTYRNEIETILKHNFLVDGYERLKNKVKPG